MSSDDFYDREGQPISLSRWSELHRTEYKIVARHNTDAFNVSTVWLGADHAWGHGSKILIFESMIFGGDFDQHQERYTTEAEALAGHARIVSNLEAGLSPDGKAYHPAAVTYYCDDCGVAHCASCLPRSEHAARLAEVSS